MNICNNVPIVFFASKLFLIYEKNILMQLLFAAQSLVPPKKSLYEKFIHGDVGIKNKYPHDCKTSATLKLVNGYVGIKNKYPHDCKTSATLKLVKNP